MQIANLRRLIILCCTVVIPQAIRDPGVVDGGWFSREIYPASNDEADAVCEARFDDQGTPWPDLSS